MVTSRLRRVDQLASTSASGTALTLGRGTPRAASAAPPELPSRATIAEPPAAQCIASTKASFAGAISAAPAGPELAGHRVRAASDSDAASRAARRQPGQRTLHRRCGRPRRAPSRAPRRRARRRPAGSVLLTAEPTPAFSRGSDDMIDSVVGGDHVGHAGALDEVDDAEHPDRRGRADEQTKPRSADGDQQPARRRRPPSARTGATIAALRGAKISCAAANGRNSRPVCSGE